MSLVSSTVNIASAKGDKYMYTMVKNTIENLKDQLAFAWSELNNWGEHGCRTMAQFDVASVLLHDAEAAFYFGYKEESQLILNRFWKAVQKADSQCNCEQY